MVAVLVFGNVDHSFVANVGLMFACVLNGLVVTHAAPVVHQMRGWRRFVANIALSLLVLGTLFGVGQPQLVKAAASFLYECGCMWWFELCCYI